jgi:serine/threonine protein phosphatase PrpC
MSLFVRAKDHFGVNRTTNEDVFRLYEELGLFIVADGSRDPDGHWAAETACEVIRLTLESERSLLDTYRQAPSRTQRLAIEDCLERAVQEACAAVYVPAAEGRRGRTSTAIEALLVLPDYAISAHVGNTRLYLLSDSEPVQLTQDHTLHEEMRKSRRSGAPTVKPVLKHQLTRALGYRAQVVVDTFPIPLTQGSAFLLCSNGLSDTFDDGAEGTAVLRKLRDSGPFEQLPQRLIEHAVTVGSDDNITAVVIRSELEQKTRGSTLDMRRQLDLLRRLDVLQAIRDDVPSLFRMLASFDYRRVPAAATIVQEGAPGDEMFILLGGKAEIQMNGKKVDIRSPGDPFGEMAFFTRELRSASVVAVEPCVLMSLKRPDFDALVKQAPELGYGVAQGVIAELSRKLKVQSAKSSH